jgi:hypothetical protein
MAATPFAVFKDPRLLFKFGNHPLDPKLQLWLFLLCIETAVWVILFALVFSTVRWLLVVTGRKRLSLFLRPVLAYVALLAALIVLVILLNGAQFTASLQQTEYELSPFYGTLILVGVVVSTTTLLSMSLLGSSVSALGEVEAAPDRMQRYLLMHRFLSHMVFAGSIALGMSTVCTGALASTIRAIDFAHGHESTFPPENVILWGGVFSLILVAFYVPARIEFYRCGCSLKNSVAEKSVDWTRSGLLKWCDEEERLRKLFRLDVGDWSSLSGGLGTLAPLLLGWIASFAK